MLNKFSIIVTRLVKGRRQLVPLRIVSVLMAASMIASLALSATPMQSALAAGPFTVNTTGDTHCTGFVAQGAPGCTAVTDSGGHISLRSALEEANTAGGTTTITLPAGTYNLSLGDLVAGTQANTTINLQGAGAASTIINQTTAGRMVIVQNYNVNSNVVLNLSGVTISGGSENENDPDGFGGNGGAILAGGSASASGVAVSITNSVFSGNYCSPVANAGCSGGAISMTGGGNLTVTNSTFSGNTASKNSGFGSGGAIYFDNGGNGGNVLITGSTFTNNIAQGNSTTGGQGGAVRLAGSAGTTYTITNNTFTGNAANGTAAAGAHGGALYLSLGSLTANFNRIVGNTNADSSGLYVANNAGSIGNAINNWWGCNGGPSAAPCDTAVLGTPNQGGSMTVSPWIVLTNTASPNPIQVNQTTTLTADFLHNSNGGSLTTSQISVLLGLPVTWGSAVKGALSNTQTSIQSNGTATATFTASAAGAGSAGATVDSGTGTASITINKADTTTNITSETPDPTVTGQSYTVNFTMTSNTGSTPTAPTGSVTVSDGTNSCTGTIGSGTCTLTSTTAGSKTLTATYSGDGNFNTSSSAGVAHTVNKADTTATITSETPNSSVVGQQVTVNYSITANSPGSGTPTGNVTVSDGTVSCTSTVAAGQCAITFTSAGAKSLTATYAGDANYNASPTSAVVAYTVNPANTTTTITSDNPDPSDVGQAVTVNFTVSVTSPGAGTPTGNVAVTDGVDSCTGTVAAGTCNITLSTPGARTLTATYAGDSNFNGSGSAGEPHTVNKFATTTTVTSDTPDPSVVGQSVTVQFTVSPTSGSGTPTGNVTVSDGTVSCTGMVSTGQCSITFTSAGAKSLTATYAGDSNFNGSSSVAEAHTVNAADTTTTITSDNPDPSVVGQAITVKFSVSVNSPGAGTPTGNVTVSDGTVSCTGTVAAGQCSLTFTSAGAKTLTATYAGDSNFNGSTSAGETHTVNAADTTTTISSDNPDPSVVGQVVTVQFNVTVNSPGAGIPTGNVTVSDGTISCTGMVAAGQCSLTFTSAGVKTLTATYAGDSNFNGSTSAGVSHTVDQAPTITSANNTSFTEGSLGSFAVTTTGFPTVSLSESGALPSGVSFVDNGDGTATLSGTPAFGTAGSYNLTLTANNGVSPNATQNFTLKVLPGTVQITVGTSPTGRSFTVDGTTYTSSQNFTWTIGASHTLATTSPQAGSAGTQYVFNNWSDGGAISHSVTTPSTAITYTASFDTQYLLTTAASPGNGGTVTPASAYYAAGTVVSLSATPNTGYTFRSWTGNIANANSATTSVTMSAPQSVTANFSAATTLLYNGGQIVNIGSSFTPAALLSSPVSACVSSKPISFTLDANPLTGAAGTYSLGSATTNSSGQATLGSINTTGWLEGIYTITANFAGSTGCDPSSSAVTLTVANAGSAASGGGWYTLSGSGRVNFGFTVSKTVSTCTSNCTYKGQLLLINTGKWRLKGTLNSYVKTSNSTGAASGTGDLYWWNQSLNGGLGDWALAKSGVSFTINFFDSGKTGKQSTDSFDINIQYTPVSPQPSSLPNSNILSPLKGGDIRVK